MEGMRCLALVLTLVTVSATATALPIVSIDSDPATPGIQTTLDVPPVGSFLVDVVISGVEAGAPLNAFELDLDFSSSILSPVSVADGGFLLDPVFVVEMNLGIVSIEFAEVTLGPIGAVGSGVLATITFDTIGVGTSPLDLNDVILSAPFGVEIVPEAIEDASITVVPEPGTGFLLGLGLFTLGVGAARDPRIRRVRRSARV